ncbi:Gustatory receptor 187b [Halyomorpha halys]|nr:Gustatory receptor 187b [Halyomorpha halys]
MMESIPKIVVRNKMGNSSKRLCVFFAVSRVLGLIPVSSELIISKNWFLFGVLIYLPLSVLSLAYIFFTYEYLPEYYTPVKVFVIAMFGVFNDTITIFHSLILALKFNILKRMFFKMEYYVKNGLTLDNGPTINLPIIWCSFLIIYLVFHTVALFVMLLQISCCISTSIFDSMFHILPFVRSNMIMLVYCFITEYAGSSVKQLKKTLNPRIQEILHILDRFDEAVILIKLNNELFGYQIFLFATGILMFTTLRSYNIIYTFQKNILSFSYLEIPDLIGCILWLMSYSASVSYTKKTIEKFNRKIFKLLMKHRELRKNERLKNQILRNCEVDFNVCGFFYGGYPLVTSILEAVVTYIVMLIQFNP